MRASKKVWKEKDMPTKRTTAMVLRYLSENDNSEFGDLFRHVNSRLGENGYSRKGFSLRLNRLILEGRIARRSYKQGHYLYYLTKKGRQNIELVSDIFRDSSYALLQEHFLKTNFPRKKEDYVQRIVERTGVYLLFSYIYGLLEYTSPKKTTKHNISNMKDWERGINPSENLGKYLLDISRNFINFDSYEEMIFSDMFEKESFYDLLQELLVIIGKKYPNEHNMMHGTSRYLDWHIDDERFNRLSYKEQFNETLKRKNKL
ncbi:conserved hypothetical protein [metagenome]